LPKVENGKEVDSNVITKNLENGLSEIIVDDKVMLRFDDKIGFFISFYPTGEPMYMGNATTSETLIFSKNRKILYKDKGSDFTIYNKDGKIEDVFSERRFLNKRFSTDYNESNIFMTCGAAASLNIIFKAIIESGDKIIVKLAGRNPIKSDKIVYFEEKEYSDLTKIPYIYTESCYDKEKRYIKLSEVQQEKYKSKKRYITKSIRDR